MVKLRFFLKGATQPPGIGWYVPEVEARNHAKNLIGYDKKTFEAQFPVRSVPIVLRSDAWCVVWEEDNEFGVVCP